MVQCAVFAGKTIEDCTRGEEGCICLKERAVSAALDLAIKEAGFARLAYDQLDALRSDTAQRDASRAVVASGCRGILRRCAKSNEIQKEKP